MTVRFVAPPDLLPIRSWRLFYDDGTTYSSADGPWTAAPDQGVEVLVLYHDPPYRTLVATDTDEYTLPGEAAVKYGRWTDDDTYSRLVALAVASEAP